MEKINTITERNGIKLNDPILHGAKDSEEITGIALQNPVDSSANKSGGLIMEKTMLKT